MSSFKNEFSWSISRDRVFQTCPRQYYFNYYGYWDGWETGAPAKTRQIYILKQLKNRYMWAGAKVLVTYLFQYTISVLRPKFCHMHQLQHG